MGWRLPGLGPRWIGDFFVSVFFCFKENHGCFGGGFNFQRFVMFSPRIFAKMIQFDVHTCFFKGWVEKNDQVAVECCFFFGVGDGERIFLIG